MGFDLSPKRFGRILDAAFELYRSNFRTVLLASGAVLFPAALLVGVSQAFYTRGLVEFIGYTMSGADPAADGGVEVLRGLTQIQLWSMLANAAAPAFLLARIYVTSALLAAAPAMLSGQRPGVKEVLKGGWKGYGWLILVVFLAQAAASISLLFLLLPGLYVWARLSVARVATVVERLPFDKAFKRSWALTRGRVLRILGFGIVLGMITFALESTVTSPAIIRQVFASIESPDAVFRDLSPMLKTLEGTLTATAVTLVHPFAEFAWFFFYLDLRARREGMDLVVAARSLAERG